MLIAAGFIIAFLLSNCCCQNNIDGSENDPFGFHDDLYGLDHRRGDGVLTEYGRSFNSSPSFMHDYDDLSMRPGRRPRYGNRFRRYRRMRMRRPLFRRGFSSMFPSGYRPMYVPYPMPFFYN